MLIIGGDRNFLLAKVACASERNVSSLTIVCFTFCSLSSLCFEMPVKQRNHGKTPKARDTCCSTKITAEQLEAINEELNLHSN
jgi:uracil-DNA glycosylase